MVVVMELIFGTALINAWIVFNSIQTDEKKLPKRLFVEKRIEPFIKKEIDEIPAPESSARHCLEKGEKRRRCVGCYQKLRTFLLSREADKKSKKILTQCSQCKKSYCLPCFNEKHS